MKGIAAVWNLKNVNFPAIDALERYPGNHYYPRIAASVARQFGDGECLAEIFGGSGWGLKPEDFERYIDYLAECGINNYTLHLWQYERNAASIKDWPPNIPGGLNWHPAFKELICRCKRKWTNSSYKENKILVVAPVRKVMGEYRPADANRINEHDGEGTPESPAGLISIRFGNWIEQLYRDGLLFDVTEERIMETYGVVVNVLKNSGISSSESFDNWCFKGIEQNSFPLLQLNGTVECIFDSIESEWTITLSDSIETLMVCDESIDVEPATDGWIARVPLRIRKKIQAQRSFCWNIIAQPNGESNPIAFLNGDFLVKNDGGYWKGRIINQILVSNNFYLTSLPQNADERNMVNCYDLLTAGFPFAQKPVVMYRKVYIQTNGILDYGSVNADCMHVSIDGIDKGFLWGPDWQMKGIAPGIHYIEIELYPSTFNVYGPHFHMDGDRHLTSPFQYSGEKSFADFVEAPDNTHNTWIHLNRFGI